MLLPSGKRHLLVCSPRMPNGDVRRAVSPLRLRIETKTSSTHTEQRWAQEGLGCASFQRQNRLYRIGSILAGERLGKHCIYGNSHLSRMAQKNRSALSTMTSTLLATFWNQICSWPSLGASDCIMASQGATGSSAGLPALEQLEVAGTATRTSRNQGT